jgi:hypothetical protein
MASARAPIRRARWEEDADGIGEDVDEIGEDVDVMGRRRRIYGRTRPSIREGADSTARDPLARRDVARSHPRGRRKRLRAFTGQAFGMLVRGVVERVEVIR